MTSRTYRVTVKMLREYAATIAIRARSQDEADRLAMSAFLDLEGLQARSLGFPPPWNEHEIIDHEPEIDTQFRCVDCGKDTGGEVGEYYTVADDVWAASGIAPHGGMLCLACLERRIGRPLIEDDFEAIFPSAEAWERHLTARNQLELFADA